MRQRIKRVMPKILDSPIQSFFLILSPSTLIKQAIIRMAEAQTSCIIVVEDQEMIGIVTERDVVKITTNNLLDSNSTLGEMMTKNVITRKVSETKDIFALSRFLRRNKIRHLPVLGENNQIEGVVTPQSIRNVLKPEYLLRYIRVKEVITKKVIHGLIDDSILIISQKMASQNVSCVVIINPQNFFPIGIITERDIVQFYSLGLDFAQVSAQTVMSTPLFTVQPQNSLWNVHKLMEQVKIRRLVVTQATGKLMGIVTQTQLLKMLDPTEMYQVMQQMQEIIDRQTNQLQQLNQELQIKNTELAHLSTVDELTQIVNRRQLNKFLDYEWQRLLNLRKPLSVIMCDVDNFKAYNDVYGHLAGDQCLIKIAQTLRAVTRQSSDLVARYGGEEFTIVLPNTCLNGAERVAKTNLLKMEFS